MSPVLRSPLAVAFAAIMLLIVAGATFATVPESKQAVIVRWGRPMRVVNPYHPGVPFGETGAGLIVRYPFMEQIVWIDKRIQTVEMDNQQVLSIDQQRLEVDAFARFRIVDPLKMYIQAKTEGNVAAQIQPILGSATRNELGKRQFAALLSPERGQIMSNIRAALNRVAAQYGAEIVDVRIKKADLPEGTLESAFQRMRTAREQEANATKAQGYKQAQIIRAEADAEAANTYAQAFNKDPEFYDFYRAMQSYDVTFNPNPQPGQPPQGKTTVILSPENDYLREFRGRK
ncbi:MAG: modulator of FtsH protease HflC [Sphingomonadales bacterium]|jgi:membrane protease subunit HflC|nr:modulator of FtsH protease HflC [Sphingomonadales bacterium]